MNYTVNKTQSASQRTNTKMGAQRAILTINGTQYSLHASVRDTNLTDHTHPEGENCSITFFVQHHQSAFRSFTCLCYTDSAVSLFRSGHTAHQFHSMMRFHRLAPWVSVTTCVAVAWLQTGVLPPEASPCDFCATIVWAVPHTARLCSACFFTHARAGHQRAFRGSSHSLVHPNLCRHAQCAWRSEPKLDAHCHHG